MPKWKLEIHQLDVGQGDSALILFKKTDKHGRFIVNKSIMIDGGHRYTDDFHRERKRHIRREINNGDVNGSSLLDVIIATNGDADHFEGLPADGIDLDITGPTTRFYGYHDFGRISHRPHYINCDVGQTIWSLFSTPIARPDAAPDMICIASNGSLRTAPVAAQYNFPTTDLNNKSLGFVVSHGSFKFFTAGDLGIEYEDRIYFGAEVSMFKVGHHGSQYSTSQTFLQTMNPRAAIISHGNRRFGRANEHHPTLATIRCIQASSVNFCYLTNPCTQVTNLPPDSPEHQKRIHLTQHAQRFIVAGHRDTVLHGPRARTDTLPAHPGNLPKSPRGHVLIDGPRSIRDDGNFTIRYKKTLPDGTRTTISDHYKSGRVEDLAQVIQLSDIPTSQFAPAMRMAKLLITAEQFKSLTDCKPDQEKLEFEKIMENKRNQKKMERKLDKGTDRPIYKMSALLHDDLVVEGSIQLELASTRVKHRFCEWPRKIEYHPDTHVGKVIVRRITDSPVQRM